MKRIFTILLVLLSCMASINATDFYSKIAATDPNAAASWNTMANGSGIDAIASDFTGSGNKFIVQTGTTMVTTAAFAFGGTTTIFQIQTGGSLQANHTITFAAGNTFQIDNGGTFIQNVAMSMGSTIFAGTEAFGASSNYSILIVPSGTSLPSAPGYGNLTINTATNATNFGWGNTILAIQGNLTIASTGSSAAIEQRLSAGTNAAITIGGNLNIEGGTFVLSSGAAASTLTVTGTVTISGGTLLLSGGSGNTTFSPNGGFSQTNGTLNLSSSTGVATISATGSFSQSAGTITKSAGTASSVINFAGTTLQIVTLSGTISNAVNFAVSNNAGISLTGTMTIGSGASLIIASTATDPIQGSGTVTYSGTTTSVSNMANLKYMAVAGTTFTGGAQTITDKVWPATNGPNAFFLDNTSTSPNNKVTSALTGDRTLIGGGSSANQLTITNGIFDIANSSIALGLNAIYSIATPNNTKMIATSGTGYFKMYMATAAFTSLTFPIGDIETSADYAELYFTYSTAASAVSFLGVQVKNTIISGDAPGADYAPRHWALKQETVVANAPSGVAFVSAPAFTHKIDGKGPTSEVVGTGSNTRLFKNVSGVYTQLQSGYSTVSTTYTTGSFNPGSFPAQSETGVDGYKYAPRTYLGQQTYTWNGTSNDYQVATNWTPTRSSLDQGDILVFNGSTVPTATVTNVAPETIGKLLLTNSAQVSITSTVALTIGGGTATGTVEVINICSTCKLGTVGAGTYSLTSPTTATTRTGTIDGELEIGGGNFAITSVTATAPAITFGGSSKLTVLSSATGVFSNGTTVASNFVLSSGAVYTYLRTSGSVFTTGTYSSGSTINVGTSSSRLTSAPSLSFPTSLSADFNYYANNASNTTFSVATGGSSISGNVTIDNSNAAGTVSLSGTSANTWTFTGAVNVSAPLKLSTATSSGSAPVYNFNRTTAPSLNISSGSLLQTTIAQGSGTTVTFTTVNIAKGLTIGNNASIIGNNTTGAVASGDLQINVNGGDVTFGTGTSIVGPTNLGNNTAKTQISFLAASGDQNYTPAVTTTGRTTLIINKGTTGGGGNVNLLTRSFNTANITLSSGKLIANDLNIVVEPVSTSTSMGLVGGSKTANSWLVLTTGKLTINKIGTAGKRFPVGIGTGTNDYVGLQIYGASGTNNATASNNNITVGVTSGVAPSTSLINVQKQIQVTWDIARSNTSINIDADFYYDDAKAGSSCTPTTAMNISRYDGTNWGLALGTTVSAITPIAGTSHGTDRVVNATGISATSPFVIGNETVLPLEFITLDAQPKGNLNIINWTTANEVNIKEFAIESSSDNRIWRTIGNKAATGGSKTTTYTYNDETPSVLNYYRIKSIEFSGKEQTSKVVAVKRNGSKFALVAVSPIPTTEGVTLDFSVAKHSRLTVVITDIVGKVVKTQSIEAIEGNNSVRLNLSNMTKGIYILSLNDGETIVTQRIIKQ